MILAPLHEVVANLFKSEGPLPLYANAGLVWDRYLPVWEGEVHNPERVKLLYNPLSEFAEAFNRRDTGPHNSAHDLLRFHHERLERAAHIWSGSSKSHTLRTLHYRVSWRLATGLGVNHPTENGFSFDSLIGVPYIPGSSVKGLCRRTALVGELDETEVERLFGPEWITADEPVYQGELVFLDAYPRRWPQLAVDIVNCHHPAYYGGRSAVPSETESPVPVFFLTVDQDSEFTFRIIGPENDLNAAEELLTQGLDLLGIGAKTAVGYGVMKKSS
jgi:CRISPR-associated protein Cmr6